MQNETLELKDCGASYLSFVHCMDQELDTKLKGFPVPHARGLYHS